MKSAIYVQPFTRLPIKVTVLGRAQRNGQEKVHILTPQGIDLWVPAKRVV